MDIKLSGLKCPECGKDLMYFARGDSIICDNSNGCDRYVVFERKAIEDDGKGVNDV